MKLRQIIERYSGSRSGPVVPTSPLIGRWTFNVADVSGATANDVIGGANGTLVGSPSLVTGLVGDQAISVNNDTTGGLATKYMVVPAASLLSRPASLSVTWWTKNLTAATLQETLVGLSKVNASVGEISFLLRWSIINKWQLIVPVIFPGGGPTASYNTNPPNGSGTHFYAATYDANATLNWRFYIDGVEKTATAVSGMGAGKPMDWGTDRNLYFLAAPNGSVAGVADGCNCIADDLRLYKRPLTSDEIAARYADPTIL